LGLIGDRTSSILFLQERLDVSIADLTELAIKFLRNNTLGADLLKDIAVVVFDVLDEILLPVNNLGNRELVKETVNTSKDNWDLSLNGERSVLGLLEKFGKTGTTVQQELGGGIQIGTELSEGSDFTVLGKEKLEGTSNLLHGLSLGSGNDTGDGKTDVNSGTDTLEEEFGFQEDLTVSDGNDVGGNVSRDITTLGLNNGKGSHGTVAKVLVHLSSTLEKTRVEVENVTRVSLTTGRTTKQKGHLTVSNSLLGQIVIDDQRVATVVTEPFTNGSTRERSEVLKRSSLRGSGGDNDGVLEGIVGLKGADKLSDSGTLLTDSNVDTVQLLGLIRAGVPVLLVKNGVESDGSLTGLTITDNQLTLTTTNRDHRVDRLDTSLHRLSDRVTGQNTGSLDLDTGTANAVKRTLTVDGVTEGIDNTTEKTGTDRNVDNGTSTLDSVTFLDQTIVTENDNTDVIGLQVKSHTLKTAGEFNHLFGLAVLQTIDTGNTVTNGENTTSLLNIDISSSTENTLLQDGRDLRGLGLGRSVASGSNGEGTKVKASSRGAESGTDSDVPDHNDG